MNKQRLVVLFDGTWNDPLDQTNVYRLSRGLHDYDGEIRQRFFYDPGLGTSWRDKWSGGIFGLGLSKNLMEGYEWLAKRYVDEDEIWIFGFSRGAYTARSLVGMIRKCGLLHITTPKLLQDAQELYRDKELHPDSEACATFRQAYSREVRIHFIGVWDTVGALGIPGTQLTEHKKYSWHDTELSGIVERAYQAAALDEHRSNYDICLWTHPEGRQKQSQIDVEQRWFIGAHSNVGGGYKNDPLSDISLRWMQSHALAAGLKLDIQASSDSAWETEPKPSFENFLGGAYAWFKRLTSKGDGKYHRHYSVGLNEQAAVNVTVDDSVWKRWEQPKFQYRPVTLIEANQEPPS